MKKKYLSDIVSGAAIRDDKGHIISKKYLTNGKYPDIKDTTLLAIGDGTEDDPKNVFEIQKRNNWDCHLNFLALKLNVDPEGFIFKNNANSMFWDLYQKSYTTYLSSGADGGSIRMGSDIAYGDTGAYKGIAIGVDSETETTYLRIGGRDKDTYEDINLSVILSQDSFTYNGKLIATVDDIPDIESAGKVKDVKILDTSILNENGEASIPKASRGVYGVVQGDATFNIGVNANGVIYMENPSNTHIKNRTAFMGITCSKLDEAVKAAMCDGNGNPWTEEELLTAKDRLGIEYNWYGTLEEYDLLPEYLDNVTYFIHE